eukprot:15338042-Ditylum_brightwellii.AAC.1
MMDQVQHAPVCVYSITSVQDSSVATLSTSPDGRVACHKIWGAVLDTSIASPRVVLPAIVPDFEDILHATGSKSDCTKMFTESLSNFMRK